ncbi:MAG: SpoIID/LytB domain-containing protein [Nitrospirae bacterium]|nr:MAG: SpoIID/LytB domain-containing protein [Nitrospirota bacterium]
MFTNKNPKPLLKVFTAAIIFFAGFFSAIETPAADTIRVLLLDNKNSKLPQKNERVEKLGNGKGSALLSGMKYSGVLEVWKGDNGLYVINELPFEEYIKGVVAAEVGSSWDIEALKAQAVVARTYALIQKQAGGNNKIAYHLTSSVLHQVYKGGNVHENISRAVSETQREVLTYEGKPIIAYYHSTSGGITEDPVEVFGKSYPYLKPVSTNCEISPFYLWEKRFSLQDLEKAANVKALEEIAIDSFTVSNRVRNLKFMAAGKEYVIPAKDLRKNIGWDKLPSTFITGLRKDNDTFIFEGKGYGHGVGMCQWSALQMAKAGKNYKEILATFYPNTIIELYENR